MLCVTYTVCIFFQAFLKQGELISIDATLITNLIEKPRVHPTCPKHKLAYVSGPNRPHRVVLVVKQLYSLNGCLQSLRNK